MKLLRLPVVAFLLLSASTVRSQTLDTLITGGGVTLHFKIIKGRGTAILFESGGALSLNQWDSIITPVYKATGATLILYDRQGFGKSSLDTSGYAILKEVKGLEQSLVQTGFDKTPLIIISHSLGGFYSRVYASRHTGLVKGLLMLDPRIPSTPDRVIARAFASRLDLKFKTENPALFYLLKAMERNSEYVSHCSLKPGLPILDIMAEKGPYDKESDNKKFKKDQRVFVKEGTGRSLIFARGTSHNIPYSKPLLVTEQLVSFYKIYQ